MKLLIAIAAAGLAAATANAQTYDFSYQFSATGNTISGEFAGFITGDTFYFTGLNWFKVNGVTMTDATYFDSTDNFYGFAPGSPSAKLDGSYLDFAIADAPIDSVSNLAILAVGDYTATGYVGADIAGATSTYGGNDGFELFNAANYSATVTSAAIPEPASWALMLGGFGLAGGALRTRRRTSVNYG